METVTAILKKLNDSISAGVAGIPCLQGASINGLAEPIVRDGNRLPAIVSASGEDAYPFVDDSYPIGLYHRLLSRSYDHKKGYGDSTTSYVLDELAVVCWGFRSKVASAYMVEPLVYASFTNIVVPLSADFDRARVFSREFQNIPFFLPEDVWLFSFQYRAKYMLSKSCIANTINQICN